MRTHGRDLTKLQKLYPGKWVALKEDQVSAIAAAVTLKEALETAKRAGYKNPTMTYIPRELVYRAGGFSLREI